MSTKIAKRASRRELVISGGAAAMPWLLLAIPVSIGFLAYAMIRAPVVSDDFDVDNHEIEEFRSFQERRRSVLPSRFGIAPAETPPKDADAA